MEKVASWSMLGCCIQREDPGNSKQWLGDTLHLEAVYYRGIVSRESYWQFGLKLNSCFEIGRQYSPDTPSTCLRLQGSNR